ncbi:hypothetical protein B9Z55_017068 [Caenorhabditis nigoni]|uniref:Uncharacterized protein n=1 Tax=Caenorhabditis nigoni TaxID=1611254 RepID=A0A2G5T8A4_9PELO|nr:hypothetical protein B9Z55_017068 [Caenorhabditis nigoni]
MLRYEDIYFSAAMSSDSKVWAHASADTWTTAAQQQQQHQQQGGISTYDLDTSSIKREKIDLHEVGLLGWF